MVPTRFAVAAHILLMVAADPAASLTSVRLASSVNTNPVVIRRIAGSLARAGLIHIRRGKGGVQLLRPAAQITLEDVWHAVKTQVKQKLLPLYQHPDPGCAANCRMYDVLGGAFGEAERALEQALSRTTLADLLQGMTQQAA